LKPQSVVAVTDLGVIGYLTNARILDMLGLVSPATMRYLPLPKGDLTYGFPSELIRDEQPDYVVIQADSHASTLESKSWFPRDYRLVASYDDPTLGHLYLLIYERTR